jgi:hypothetical protein
MQPGVIDRQTGGWSDDAAGEARVSTARNRRRRTAHGLSLLLPLIVAVSACEPSDSGNDASSNPTEPSTRGSTPSRTSPADAARAQALSTYRAMWRDWVVAGRTADYRSPTLADHAIGQALRLLVGGLHEANQQGVVIKGEPVLHPKVTALKPSTTRPSAAEITDCLDSARWLSYDKRTGELQDNTPGGHRRVTATVGNIAGSWKVTVLTVKGLGTC